MITIYKISNSVNDKLYVGQTHKTLQERLWQHKAPSEKRCRKLHRAFDKYGRENFTIEKLTDAYTQKEADVLEIHFIAKFDAISNGYNLKKGGSRGTMTEESKARCSLAQMGNTKTLGHKDSEETRTKKSRSMKGNTNALGYRHSPDTLERMSAIKKLQHANPDSGYNRRQA